MRTYPKDFIQKLRKGSRAEQKEVFNQLYPPLFRLCRRYVVREDEAEDCLLKGFMKAFQQIDRFEYTTEESFFWWIRKIMINEALMSVRRKNTFYMMPEENIPDTPVEASVWASLEAEDIETLIMRLPAGYRTVFSLHVLDGYEHKEIAAMLSITESTSKTQLYKAKGKLRQLLEQNGKRYGTSGR